MFATGSTSGHGGPTPPLDGSPPQHVPFPSVASCDTGQLLPAAAEVPARWSGCRPTGIASLRILQYAHTGVCLKGRTERASAANALWKPLGSWSGGFLRSGGAATVHRFQFKAAPATAKPSGGQAQEDRGSHAQRNLSSRVACRSCGRDTGRSTRTQLPPHLANPDHSRRPRLVPLDRGLRIWQQSVDQHGQRLLRSRPVVAVDLARGGWLGTPDPTWSTRAGGARCLVDAHCRPWPVARLWLTDPAPTFRRLGEAWGHLGRCGWLAPSLAFRGTTGHSPPYQFRVESCAVCGMLAEPP